MKRRKRKIWKTGAIATLALVAIFGGYLGFVQLTGNFHPVVAGELYRSAQPTAAQIADYKSRYRIRTIINLRGRNPKHAWYRQETAAARRLGIAHIDYRISARSVLAQPRAAELIEIMRNAEKPILIHCHSGSDRSGLAAALYLAATGRGETAAEGQLSVAFGHLGIPFLSRTHAMDETFENLEPWLGIPNS